MPSARWRLSDDARRDLRGIAYYTKRTWGPEQAERYRLRLEAAFDRLASYPDAGRERDDLKVGARVLPVEQHLVVFRAEVGGVLILRVIHQRMDLGSIKVP